jgi:hypothetical protein
MIATQIGRDKSKTVDEAAELAGRSMSLGLSLLPRFCLMI